MTPKVCQQGLEAPGATVSTEVRSLDGEKAFMRDAAPSRAH